MQTKRPNTPPTVLVFCRDRALASALHMAFDVPELVMVPIQTLDQAEKHMANGTAGGPVLIAHHTGDALNEIRDRAGLEAARVLAVVDLARTDERASVMAQEALRRGADDFVHSDALKTELSMRVRALIARPVKRRHSLPPTSTAEVALEITHKLASSLEVEEILFTVVSRIAEAIHVDRVSLVLSPSSGDTAYVVATSDDQTLRNLQIDLNRYPEIREVLRSGEPLNIHDVATHPVLDQVRSDLPERTRAISLIPLVWQNNAAGVMFIRAGGDREVLSRSELDFCETIANTTAIALRNARIMQRLRNRQVELSLAQGEAEQRVKTLERYAEVFASAPDGIAVVSREGTLLFANPKAFEILGYEQSELLGYSLSRTLDPDSFRSAEQLWRDFEAGDYRTDMDFTAQRRDGEARLLNASFSALSGSEGSILVQFRDVTVERNTAAELKKTTEFLESLINASVDAIVAADLEGRIILFNKGAERIYGYPASRVLEGQLHVTALYPEGVAAEVMRRIRAEEHGGNGRLESMQSTAVHRGGQRIPISLSAAMIFENGSPVATVGIFTDLRERIRAEERLARTEKRLEFSEKQALLAELAGTAAHELNQPLTSVMGYAELLARKLPEGSGESKAANVIVKESERMAELVRKIGKITRYETKSYVGEQKILDLDRAAADELPASTDGE